MKYWHCFSVEKHVFKMSQPRYLENPLATGRVARSTAKSSPCRKYVFFLMGEEKGEVCAVVRINPACSAQALAGGGADRSPWPCMHSATEPLLSPCFCWGAAGAAEQITSLVLYSCCIHASPSQPAHAGIAGHSCSPSASDLFEPNLPSLTEALPRFDTQASQFGRGRPSWRPRWTETACIYLISVLISSKCNYKAGVALGQNYMAI